MISIPNHIRKAAEEFLVSCGFPAEIAKFATKYVSEINPDIGDVSGVEAEGRFAKIVARELLFHSTELDTVKGSYINLERCLERSETTLEFKQSQFGSCSYDEITWMIQTRIRDLREYRKFRASPVSKEFPQVRASLLMRILIVSEEIRYLLSKRRDMKRDSREADRILK